jgi:hypothetical protein
MLIPFSASRDRTKPGRQNVQPLNGTADLKQSTTRQLNALPRKHMNLSGPMCKQGDGAESYLNGLVASYETANESPAPVKRREDLDCCHV